MNRKDTSKYRHQELIRHISYLESKNKHEISSFHYFVFIYDRLDFEKLPPKVRSSVEVLEKATADCTGFLLNICLSYGSRAEIVMACNAAIVEKQKQQEMIQQEKKQRENFELVGMEPKESPGIISKKSHHISCKSSSRKATVDINPYDSLSEESNAVTVAETDRDDDDSFESVQGENFSSQQQQINRDNLDRNIKEDISRSHCWCQDSKSYCEGSPQPLLRSISGSSGDQTKFMIDEQILSRHMCTDSIPGTSKLGIIIKNMKYYF